MAAQLPPANGCAAPAGSYVGATSLISTAATAETGGVLLRSRGKQLSCAWHEYFLAAIHIRSRRVLQCMIWAEECDIHLKLQVPRFLGTYHIRAQARRFLCKEYLGLCWAPNAQPQVGARKYLVTWSFRCACMEHA
eukprot:CAMPEP_0195621036 /NCGR_PEP_ID=MMETSP0815-20121206/15476_1 /TAXON_ID=97485 /ORGANISM="Prymnesium parvum, Strain Texoma1" /LENGTH=135 /DNA_ID=CAMNT_0040761761 /DNA_START=318 /DNA_END=723 /DNA_ORIENTATION=-